MIRNPVTQVREDIRSVEVTARSAGAERLDPARIGSFVLTGTAGQRVPIDQIGRIEIRMEEPIMRRRDREPTIRVQSDVDEAMQPPDVSNELIASLEPIL